MLRFYVAFYLAFYLEFYLAFCLAFCLAYTVFRYSLWHLSFSLTFCLTYVPTNILTLCLTNFQTCYLAYILAWSDILSGIVAIESASRSRGGPGRWGTTVLPFQRERDASPWPIWAGCSPMAQRANSPRFLMFIQVPCFTHAVPRKFRWDLLIDLRLCWNNHHMAWEKSGPLRRALGQNGAIHLRAAWCWWIAFQQLKLCKNKNRNLKLEKKNNIEITVITMSRLHLWKNNDVVSFRGLPASWAPRSGARWAPCAP